MEVVTFRNIFLSCCYVIKTNELSSHTSDQTELNIKQISDNFKGQQNTFSFFDNHK